MTSCSLFALTTWYSHSCMTGVEDDGVIFNVTIWLWDFPAAEPVIVIGKAPADVAALAVTVSVDFPLPREVRCEVTPLGKQEGLRLTLERAQCRGKELRAMLDDPSLAIRINDVG